MTTPESPSPQPAPDLIQRLRGLVCGFHEWRVESPVDGSYCLSRTRDDCVDPERECREWLEREKKTGSIFAGYVVKHHHVMTAKDKALAEAADALATLEARDVTRIMLDVAPGSDGMGEEVYATSVSDVEAVLTRMGQQIEDLEARRAPAIPAPEGALRAAARQVVAERERYGWSPEADRAIYAMADVLRADPAPAEGTPATGDVWLEHDDDLRFVARVLSGGLQAPAEDIKAAREIVHGLRTTARSHVQAPAEGDALPNALRVALEDLDAMEFNGPTTEAVIDAAQRWYLASKAQPKRTETEPLFVDSSSHPDYARFLQAGQDMPTLPAAVPSPAVPHGKEPLPEDTLERLLTNRMTEGDCTLVYAALCQGDV